jgi:hypothetical protein
LSKGYGLIHRFSEDIDIRIEPPENMAVAVGKNHHKPKQIDSRKRFYQWLADGIVIDGIVEVERDHNYDDLRQYRGAGIRLNYDSPHQMVLGLKDGILLEVGFDNVTPHQPIDISSWAYDRAVQAAVDVIDNRALAIECYHSGYTFVEKLQAVSTKYRQQQDSGTLPANFIRHYYDIYCLLQSPQVLDFIGTQAYHSHKKERFRQADNQNIAQNKAFILADDSTRQLYIDEYARTKNLYYQEQPHFEDILSGIHAVIDKL